MSRDNLAYAIVGIVIWVAGWQLADLLFGQKPRETQIKIYATFMIAGILAFLLMDRCGWHK